ncbi:MAG TPA: glycosyltransferase family 2 protein [Candidatus Levybacteria bacterium]|nr:glycosyltransferase family 2 protein [Candidatus Levybacteria bacterium]
MEPYLSIVIPIFNEEDSVHELVEQIQSAMKKLSKPYEIIFVDDGSTDKTVIILKNLKKKLSQIQILSHRRNLGKSHALMHGFERAQGKYIATLDADLQDNPEEIVLLLSYLKNQDLDMVTGWRKNRQDTGSIKSVSRIANGFILKVFKLTIHDLNAGLKVYKAEAAKELNLYGGLHRFIPIMLSELGYKVGEHEVKNRPRKFGYSKYRASKVLTDLPDLFTIYFLTKFTDKPLHFFGRIGFVPLFSGSLILGYLSILRLFFDQSIGTRPLLMFGVLMVIFGMQLMLTGLLGDLIVNMNMKKRHKLTTHYEE